MSSRTYELVPGFFLQDSPNADHVAIGPIPRSFGLLSHESPSAWVDFASKISELNSSAEDGTAYKVLYLGRHGEGYHNVAEAKYGNKAWNEYWSILNDDGELIWGPDPSLTSIGEGQARTAYGIWATELLRGMPLPHKLYASPLTRALQTYELTFTGIIPPEHPKPIILEMIREEYGEHTCDKRRRRSEIQAAFPKFVFEEEFAEEDPLWTPKRESKAHEEVRARSVLDRIFTLDVDDTFISITAHSGIINAFLRVIGRGDYPLPTGGVIFVVVKGSVAQQKATDVFETLG